MNRKLRCLMSAVLALSICMPGGVLQAVAQEGGGVTPSLAPPPGDDAGLVVTTEDEAADPSAEPSVPQGEQTITQDPALPEGDQGDEGAAVADGGQAASLEAILSPLSPRAGPLRASASPKVVNVAITKFEL